MADIGETTPAPPAEYEGLPGRTRQVAAHYTCPSCGFLFGAQLYSTVNVSTDGQLSDLLSKGELNILTCPACAAIYSANVPLIYHDPKASRFALLLPESMRHRELEERARLLSELAADPSHIPDYVKRADVVFGTTGLLRLLDETLEALTPKEPRADEQARLKESLEERRAELERREAELQASEEDMQAKLEDLVTARAKLEEEQVQLGGRWAELEREREAVAALAVDLQARERSLEERVRAHEEKARAASKGRAAVDKLAELHPPAARPPVAESATELVAPKAPQPADKPAAEAPAVEKPAAVAAAAITVEEKLEAPEPKVPTLVLEGRPETEVDRWRAGDLRTGRIVHEGRVFLLAKPEAELLPTFRDVEPTLMVQLREFPTGPVVVLVVLPAAVEPTLGKALFWMLDPASTPDQALLGKLAEECLLHLDLYDDESRAVATWEIQPPLTENVRHVLKRAEEMLTKGDVALRDFAKSERALVELGDERFGRKQHNFSADSFQDLATPGAARLALGIVSYWSEPDNQDYLMFVKSFPVIYWRSIRDRVARRALEFGLRLPPPLAELAVEQKVAGSRQELLRMAVANFAEVSLRIKASDLDARQEWDNWKQLLADCVQHGVEVEAEMEELAAAAARRAGVAENEAAPGGDLGQLSEDMLLPLLEDRELRCDAALELCERGSAKALEAMFVAICNMTRTEVARVVPAMTRLGATVIPFFLQGMRHRKSFIRQGCALALGAMKAEAGLEPLMDMLLGEPTNVWREAARALGDAGSVALGALIAGVRSADAAGRERIAWALSQAALDAKCRQEVEAMTRSRDTRLARVAHRAMELFDQVRQNDAEVRGGKPLREQTIVRSFSRRFFEYMSSDVSELGEGDIVEREEILDDTDIVDEEVEVGDDDILNR